MRRFSAVFLGLVFCVSGLLKLMDPVGTSLIVDGYLNFFHLSFLSIFSKAGGELLSLLEFVVGASLVTGVRRKIAAVFALSLMSVFTVITLILLIANPDMDCGCFGQAIHLTHFQSFIKNVVLDLLWCAAFLPLGRDMGEPRKSKTVSFFITVASAVAFGIYSLVGIPLQDFTPYAAGEELVADDDMDVVSVPLLSFYDENWEYCDSLALDGAVAVFSVFEPAKADWEKIADGVRGALVQNIKPLVIIASAPGMEESDRAREALGDVYYSDRRTILTLNRSNGGLTYIDGGLIVSKWAASDYPDTIRTDAPAEQMLHFVSSGQLKMQGFLLYVFAVMLLL